MTHFSFPQPPRSAPPLPVEAHHQPPQPPAPPLRRTGKGWKVVAILSLLALMVSIVGNVLLFFAVAMAFGAGGMPSQHVNTETIQHGSFGSKIAIMPLDGVVDSGMVEKARRFCDYVYSDKSIKAVIVEVDSPGGTITASDEIHHMLTKLAQHTKLVVSMRGLAASGGYYISMPAEKIYAQPTTLTGSIGVIMQTVELTELMEKIGVQPETVKSDAAEEFKDAGSPFKKFTEADRQYFKGIINSAHRKFADVVAKGRPALKDVKAVANGRIWTADDALKFGLIDEIAHMDEVIAKTASDVGLSNPTVIRLERRLNFFEALGASTGMGPRTVEVKFDPSMLENMKNPTGLQFRYEGMR